MTCVNLGGARSELGSGEDERSLVASRHDPGAFAAFYDRRYDRVIGFFYRRILCPHTAAELTAETFARVWAKRDTFDVDQGSAMGWTLGIAGNLYRQWSAKGAVERSMLDRLRVETPALVEEDLDHIDGLVDLAALRQVIDGALDDLSPSLRDAVILRVVHDLPYDDVARKLGCSVVAARVRVSRALDRLYGQMEDGE